jgi:hypothetical protein
MSIRPVGAARTSQGPSEPGRRIGRAIASQSALARRWADDGIDHDDARAAACCLNGMIEGSCLRESGE